MKLIQKGQMRQICGNGLWGCSKFILLYLLCARLFVFTATIVVFQSYYGAGQKGCEQDKLKKPQEKKKGEYKFKKPQHSLFTKILLFILSKNITQIASHCSKILKLLIFNSFCQCSFSYMEEEIFRKPYSNILEIR